MDLSIVIPAFNEAPKIRNDIAAGADFLCDRGLSGEIIVADDGSTDGTANRAQQTRVPDSVVLHVLTLPHRGKGHAVRAGILASCGQVVLCVDSGGCTPLANALQAIEWIRAGSCQIAVGSRKLAASCIVRGQALHRRACSALLRRAVIWTFPELRRLSDTQCGFKIFAGDVARTLFAESVIDGFLFDVEVLARAIQRGCTVREFPIEWTCDPDSRVSTSRALMPVLRDLVRIRRSTGLPHQARGQGH
jgi:dolichyl-phosphate beta-glucosyltransferase